MEESWNHFLRRCWTLHCRLVKIPPPPSWKKYFDSRDGGSTFVKGGALWKFHWQNWNSTCSQLTHYWEKHNSYTDIRSLNINATLKMCCKKGLSQRIVQKFYNIITYHFNETLLPVMNVKATVILINVFSFIFPRDLTFLKQTLLKHCVSGADASLSWIASEDVH